MLAFACLRRQVGMTNGVGRWRQAYRGRLGRVVPRRNRIGTGQRLICGGPGTAGPRRRVWGCAGTPTNALRCKKAHTPETWPLRVDAVGLCA